MFGVSCILHLPRHTHARKDLLHELVQMLKAGMEGSADVSYVSKDA